MRIPGPPLLLCCLNFVESLQHRRLFARLVFIHRLVHKTLPDHLCDLIISNSFHGEPSQVTRQSTYSEFEIIPFKYKTLKYSNCFVPSKVAKWNRLPGDLIINSNLSSFKKALASHLKFKTNLTCSYSFSLLHNGKLGKVLTNISLGIGPLNDQLFCNNLFTHHFCPHCVTVRETNAHFFLFVWNILLADKNYYPN